MTPQEVKDLATIKFELEALRHHSDINKKYREEDRTLLLNIHSTLVGNNTNNHKGIVNLIEDIDYRVKLLEKNNFETIIYKNQSKFVIGAIVIILLGILIQSIMNGNQLENVKKFEKTR